MITVVVFFLAQDEIPGTFRYSIYMKETQVKIISPSVCASEDYYGKKVTENQFCAASPSWTEDTCQVWYQ